MKINSTTDVFPIFEQPQIFIDEYKDVPNRKIRITNHLAPKDIENGGTHMAVEIRFDGDRVGVYIGNGLLGFKEVYGFDYKAEFKKLI